MAKSAQAIEPGVLDELNRLGAARGPIAGWLAGLEARRESVSAAVYGRVREDYAKRIADLDELARPLRIAATHTLAVLDEQLAALETEKRAVEFDLQEVELRRFLEEYSEVEFKERAQVPRDRLAELGLELDELQATRERWLAARGEEIPEIAAPATPSAPAAGRTAAASVPPAAPAPAPLAPAVPAPAPAAPSLPAHSPMSTVPAAAELRPLSPASITMPRPIAPPRPSSPAIPVPATADAGAHTVHLSGPPLAALPSPAPVAARPEVSPISPMSPKPAASPASPAGLDGTVIYTPEPPSPQPQTGETGDAGDAVASTLRLVATLVAVESGDGSAPGYALAADNTIGRVRENSIQIQHGSVSRHHAILRFTADGWMLEDLKAENGTWVNGDRIEKRRLLDGDRVNIGTVRFLFHLG